MSQRDKGPGTALITGANGGIGRALCEEFRSKGYRVVGTDITPSEDGADSFVVADLNRFTGDAEYRGQILKEIRRAIDSDALEALVNNAAVQFLGSCEAITVEDFQSTLNVNLLAPFLLIQDLLPMLELGHGTIINIGSIHAILTKPKFVAYATSKAALAGLTSALAIDLAPRVRVNAVAPGATATPMLTAGFAGRAQALKQLEDLHPISRIADPHEIAKAALFLASDSASYVTGSVLRVDGGMGARLHDPE